MIPALLLPLVLAASDPLAVWDFAEDDGGFQPSGEADQWEWGPVASGPGAGWNGEDAWATLLDRDYFNDGDDYLTFPTLDLTGASRPVLGLAHWYDIDEGGDAGLVERWDGAAWQPLEPVYGYPTDAGFTGASDGWVEDWFDLDGVSDASLLRLAFHADASGARAGWYLGLARIEDGDPVPPLVVYTLLPEDTQDVEGPYAVAARIVDDLGAVSAELRWSDGVDEGTAPLAVEADGETWDGELDGVEPGTELCWWIEATDGDNLATGETACFSVRLPAPGPPAVAADRPVGAAVPLAWEPPEDPLYPVLGYVVYRDGEPVAWPVDPEVELPVSAERHEVVVSAVFDTPRGDREGEPSEALELETAIPAVVDLSPAEVWQGERVHLAVTARYLLLGAEGVAELDAGEGVEVVDTEVLDVDRAVFTVEVAADAATGARALTLTGGAGSATLEDALTVLDGADRPALLAISPDAAEQGEALTLEISASEPPEASPTVDLGDGIIVGGIEVDGATIRVEATVEADAPVGLHPVTVDDGRRVLGGVELRVRDRAAPPEPVCGCAAGGSRAPTALALLSLLAAALAFRRRG